MTVLVFAPPYVPPAPPTPPWRGYKVVWHGWDGSSWDLTNWRTSGVCLLPGVSGLHVPLFDDFTVRSPTGSGQRYKGSRTQPRAVSFSVLVYSDVDSLAWEARNDAFWRAFRPDLPGTLEVVSPGGKRRFLDLRFTPQSTHAFDRDPVQDGWAIYTIDLTADKPYYLGPEEVAFEWEPDPTSNLPFIAPTGGPPFNITNTTGTADAALTNPGDVPLYLTWVVEGELSAEISVGGGLLSVPTVPEGYVLTIKTDPKAASATLVGPDGVPVEVWETIDPWDPRRLPVGVDVPVGLTLVGSGKIRATYRAGYFRAT